jgi:hypothetical protein
MGISTNTSALKGADSAAKVPPLEPARRLASLRATKFNLFNPFQMVHFNTALGSEVVEIDSWNKVQMSKGLLEIYDSTRPVVAEEDDLIDSDENLN